MKCVKCGSSYVNYMNVCIMCGAEQPRSTYPLRSHRLNKEERERLISEIKEGKSPKELAEKYHVNHSLISHLRRKLGVIKK